MRFDPWDLPLPAELPGFPTAAKEQLNAAAAAGRDVDAGERDAIIRAAGAEPDDWKGDALAEKARRWNAVVANEHRARQQREREQRINRWRNP